MSRNYKEMPPLWRVQQLLKLSDAYPSGLEWVVDKACNKAGSQAGRQNKSNGYYVVSIDNEVYLAHRLVHYLRTERDPLDCDILHCAGNGTKDNRQEFVASRKYRRRPKSNW